MGITDANKEKRGAILRILLSVVMIVFFVCVVFVYYRMLVTETRDVIVSNGRANAIEQSNQIDQHMSASMDTLKLAGYTVDNMIRTGRTQEEILDYLVNETIAVGDSLIANTTGIYGYIRGEYMDGSGWVPDEGYDPTARPWYTEAMAGGGEIIIVDPYVDLDTGAVMIALAYTLSDGESVVGIDISLDELQELTEAHVEQNKSYAEFIINDRGKIVAHSNKKLVGMVLGDGSDYLTDIIGRRLSVLTDNYFYLEQDGSAYMIYVMPLENDWTCVSVIDATDDFNKMRFPLAITLITAMIMVGILVVFTVRFEKKNREARQSSIESERAVAANEAKTSFLSSMSHEIRTPINAILGMNEMILREEENEDILTYSENIRTAGNTLLGLINDILDFSKIEAGKIEIIPVDYDLSSVINDLVNMIKTRADNKGLELELNIDHDIPKLLHGDEVRIKQIITNILTNAVKYTEKGSVTFLMSCTKIASRPDHVILNVAVKDTGIGIKDEDIGKLFSEFDRIEEERNRNIEGTGLGLSITKSLLDLMDSSLHVQSVYGEGSTFSFGVEQEVISWEPIGDYERAYRTSISRRKKYKEKFIAPSARILVVDDNPMNLIVFSSLIKQTQIKIDTASSADEGIAKYRSVKYDLIFLDHMMPGKDGIEALHEMREIEDNPNGSTPVICLTANAVSGARQQYIEEGFDDYLTKPIDAPKLEELLFDLLPKEKIEAESVEAAIKSEKGASQDNGSSQNDKIYDEIREAAAALDCDRLEEAVAKLDMSDSKAGKIKEAADNFDYDEVARIIGEN